VKPPFGPSDEGPIRRHNPLKLMTMTQNEVINKLSMEMAVALGDLDHLDTCRFYIQLALVIGAEQYGLDGEEIIQMDTAGLEIRRFKSIRKASEILGIDRRNISHVLNGDYHTVGGFMFMKARDKERLPAKKTA
jgi:hypothetical protein